MKRCAMCGVEKPQDEFHRYSRHKDGLQSYCKACKRDIDARLYRSRDDEWRQHKYQKQRDNANTKIRLLLEYLKEHPCVDCGEADILVLEFDHVSGVKKANIGDMWQRGWSWERVRAEIDKCDVRCANCHRRATAKRQGMNRYLLLLQAAESEEG